MTYQITNEVRIENTEDDWYFRLVSDEYGTVSVVTSTGTGNATSIHIPKDCIQHFINALQRFQ